jgi:5-methyltetrahydropteroyltriglutamate--homocysteine methyltransferase
MKTYAYGFPRLGKNREYKKIIESFWKKQINAGELKAGLDNLEKERLATYAKYVDNFPACEMTYYDNMLDTALMFGVYTAGSPEDYYDLCRGGNALEMRKWFNTNYHYLLPQFGGDTDESKFRLAWNKIKETNTAAAGAMPYLIGPYTFLKLAKGIKKSHFPKYMMALAGAYAELLKGLGDVHIDEPAFVTDVPKKEVRLIKEAYAIMGAANSGIHLFTYYESVSFLKDLYALPVKAIGLDFVNGTENFGKIKKLKFPDDKILIAGVVNGRNVWRTDVAAAAGLVCKLRKYAKNIVVSNAGPLYHLPVTLSNENGMEEGLRNRLAFAEERLHEIRIIADLASGKAADGAENYNVKTASTWSVSAVQERIRNLKESDFVKPVQLEERKKIQGAILNLPLFPTTTIGSFPQTQEIRSRRADFRAGKLSEADYGKFIDQKIEELVRLQEELGLDVFVHGEYERTDMVEFFAEKLGGIATTKNGWIISYGTRGYRPPIIFGDISRPKPMTVKEIVSAQGKTKKPVKGMLTGPVTIIAWSFVREDIPLEEVAYQIALCLKDEIADYESGGIKIVQIDEPAFREKAPIKTGKWEEYFRWAIRSFNLSSQSKPETQIHTHMCYSAFGEIIDKINQMDFDKITIEASRSKGDIIKSFEKINFRRQIGIGVWDIHSPKIPTVAEMRKIVRRVLKVIPKENFWINPDCGLKTRGWDETIPSLKNMVELAVKLRKKY